MILEKVGKILVNKEIPILITSKENESILPSEGKILRVLKINFIVTKPATTVEQCQIKSKKKIDLSFFISMQI